MEQIHGGDIYTNEYMLDYSANINPQGPPKGVIEAVIQSVSQISCYPDIFCRQLVSAIAESEQMPAEQILCGNGAAELIFLLTQYARPEKAILPAPTFAEYEQALVSCNCRIEYYWTDRANGFCLKKDILDLLQEDVDMMFLCNPNNPTGNLISQEVLDAVIERCEEKKILLVIDECFLDFVSQGERYSRKKDLMYHPNILILKAFTKLYAMPGLRLGYLLGSDTNLLEKIASAGQPWRVSVPAQMAGIAALKEKAYVQNSIEKIAQERAWLLHRLENAGLHAFSPEANYIFFEGPVNLFEKCRQQRILIRDCSNYPGLMPGDYRIAVRFREDNIRLMDTIDAMLQEEGEWCNGKTNYDSGNNVKCRKKPADCRLVPDF